MYMIAEVSQYVAVASFAEAWIEIVIDTIAGEVFVSPPSRRRGLKYTHVNNLYSYQSRLLRGGVD